jgi:tryptophan-rich sensory protein
MAFLFQKSNSTFVWVLFGVQFVTNVAWNYLFFNQHLIFPALIDLIFLTVLVWFMFFKFRETLGFQSLFLTPYMGWLLIAISLNAYAWLKNQI